MIARPFTLILFLLSLITVARSQSADVYVKLSLIENKSVFRIGEPIKIALDFTADRSGYVVEYLPEGNQPTSDTIVVSPDTGITHWYADYMPGELPQALTALTESYYSDAISALLNRLLETDDLALAPPAAFLIGLHGRAMDQRLLEARLKRWREQWANRAAEADAQEQGQIERELIEALINGKAWKLPPERVRELQLSCVTELRKQSNVVRE